ncbi:3-isopropylmalate dehydratase small subunit [Pseudoxanthomonas jiangsuensis]|uniref:3-isopropylmalate dehydratase small subunit n=1 Tax=Pseudoxanthomonas jiangsuensis TaxID=619688 RepID=UPI001390D629|nr:3-isopropylmalate dehydratase small subunit [Pseudoxanthomonas jiangsuensis]KAF1697278.1 3-isopropylmalate dehydratase small subunit [Pseudoxanthomonas jiangsuensis]
MMPFTRLDAVAAPLPLVNVDTDKILPAPFLKTISRTGLGKGLFHSLRSEPDFILNHAPWDQAGILVALDNFGCGSSREHAPWALLDFGIRCVIAPSIADIFYNNCCKNGILPIVLPHTDIDRLMALATDPATATLSVDLAQQTVRATTGLALPFVIDAQRKQDLLQGVDDIARSLTREADIAAYEHAMDSRQVGVRAITQAGLDG